MSSSLIKYFDRNKLGKDYVVGDIHANFSKLKKSLDCFFNPKVDRLFCTGDLVDRGHEHDMLLYWLEQPWFHSVRGNHEDMIIKSRGDETQAYMSRINGGQWFVDLSRRQQDEILAELNKLPLAIEIDGRFGILHADLTGTSWDTFKQFPLQFEEIVLWSRLRIKGNYYAEDVPGLERLYVGHTPTKIEQIANVYYMDNGAWYQGSDEVFRIKEITYE